MHLPRFPRPFLLLALVLGLTLVVIQLGAISVAFDKLGLSAHSAALLLFTSLFGSFVELPLMSLPVERLQAAEVPWLYRGLWPPRRPEFQGRTQVTVNVGGCLVPASFSVYLLLHQQIPVGEVILAVAAVAVISRVASRPIPGLGIAMPLFVAPLSAVLVTWCFHAEHNAALAYLSGTLGVLIGADLMRLSDIRRLGAPRASIGGAGTFDGIFLTGILAVLLA
jgi:uncharacterized membrane protein